MGEIEYSGTVHLLCVKFKTPSDSVREKLFLVIWCLACFQSMAFSLPGC